jgi:hypothetical protein
MPKFTKIKIKHKADKAVAAGEEIELETEVDVPQDQFDAAVRDRLNRKDAQLQEVIDSKNALTAELEKLKKTGEEKPDEAASKRMAELEKQLKETRDQIAERDHRDQVRQVIEKNAPKLPPIFRDRVNVKPGASAEDIAAAVTEQVEAYKVHRKELGLSENPDEPAVKPQNQGIGFSGSGGPQAPKPGAGKAALELVSKHPKLMEQLNRYDEATKEAVAAKMVADGTLTKFEASQQAQK